MLDADWPVHALSRRFRFKGAEVEFCTGLAPLGDALVMTLDVEDREARIAVVDRDAALGLLEPVGPSA
jgi:hypothetical protein